MPPQASSMRDLNVFRFFSSCDKEMDRMRTLQLPMRQQPKSASASQKYRSGGTGTSKWRITALSFRRFNVCLVIVLGLCYVCAAMLLIATHQESRQPSTSAIINMLFDSHVHESEEILTLFLHNQALSSSSSSSSQTGYNAIADVEEVRLQQQMSSQHDVYAATIQIRTVDAPAIGLQVLGKMGAAISPEELARRSGMWHYQWFLVRGQPIFVTQDCSNAEQVYYSTRRIMLQTAPTVDSYCHHAQTTPQTWKRMRQLAMQLGQKEHIVNLGIVSLGFYASHNRLAFSIASTDSIPMLPLKLQNILHGARLVESNLWSPAYVERLVNDKSWVLVKFPESTAATTTTAAAKTPVTTFMHDSASSLCQSLPIGATCPTSEMMTIGQDFPIQCVSVHRQKSPSTKASKVDVKVLGQWRIPTFETVMVRVDWLWALGLATLLLILKIFRIGNSTGKSRMQAPLTVFFYLLAVVVYKYSKPNNAGLVSTESISTTIIDSYRTFVAVHPISIASPMIAWSHICTYWFEIAAWRSPSMQGVLFWYLCYELVASYVNEHYHALEEDNAVRCSRVSFIAAMKQYAVDDVVRAYLLPPFFVYLYLLPRLMWEYISVYFLSIFF